MNPLNPIRTFLQAFAIAAMTTGNLYSLVKPTTCEEPYEDSRTNMCPINPDQTVQRTLQANWLTLVYGGIMGLGTASARTIFSFFSGNPRLQVAREFSENVNFGFLGSFTASALVICWSSLGYDAQTVGYLLTTFASTLDISMNVLERSFSTGETLAEAHAATQAQALSSAEATPEDGYRPN